MQHDFDNLFRAYKHLPIALYGLGMNTHEILSQVTGYNIIGLIANEHIGEIIYGKKVMALKEALVQAKVIVIAAVPKSTAIVYQRIKNSIPDNILLFDMRGRRLYKEDFYHNNAYWQQTKVKLIQAIEAHEVVSFDVFDTLLMRRVLKPEDVFVLVEQGLHDEGMNVPFVMWRVQSEKALTRHGEHYPTLLEIYDYMELTFQLSKSIRAELYVRELAVEKRCFCVREDMLEMFRYALKQKKRVFLISDMYLDSLQLKAILADYGIEGYEKIFVSCEHNCSKSDGRLYDCLLYETYGKKRLHIGDNLVSDIQMAEKKGIDTFYVMSGEEMLLSSSIAGVYGWAQTIGDRMLLANIIAQLFNSPFALSETKGKVFFQEVRTLSFVCFASITVCFLSWLRQIVREHRKAILLFVSRDGYYLEKKYQIIRQNNIEDMPEARYFYTSRLVASTATLLDITDVRVLLFLLHTRKEMNLKKFLEARFEIPFDKRFDLNVGMALEVYGYDVIVDMVFQYSQRFAVEIAERRQRYLAYIATLHLEQYDEIYVVDLVTQGTVAYSLQRLLRREIKLIAYGAVRLPGPYIPKGENVFSLYKDTGECNEIFWFIFNILEVVYASPEGQCRDFTLQANPEFALGTTYDANLLQELQSGMDMFIQQYNSVDAMWFCRQYSCEFVSNVMGIIRNGFSDIADNVMDLFHFGDSLTAEREMNILKEKRW